MEIIRGRLEQAAATDSKGKLLSWEDHILIAKDSRVSVRKIEHIALQNGIMPAKYQRNRNTITIEEQLKLFQSKVAVVGCGGLGGYVIEELTRLGVGTLTLIDPDIFEEHNLNRQVLSSVKDLKSYKAKVAAKRVKQINPAVKVRPIVDYYSLVNGKENFEDVDLVIDALDNISTRLDLAQTCKDISVPLIHGAIAGWFGQVTTQYPEEHTIEKWYGRVKEKKGIEGVLGNPSFTPAVVASIQVAEACKVLLDKGETLRNKVMSINLLDMEFELFTI
ncbi:thiamine biosynthesis protein ThiF [Desulfuribacillus stibiiarsenatis]|uniref:Thiamine biosynthesis protein ThiF n=2 Tax=Desulfuribacillus stibiiarsenatis TaxID=1390249 RepID=A0A1E5L7K0_9FIRM|nr:thiamine biosynthesis protein ThiF [Desulfuribacillus stibiiarsenatis]